MISYSVRDLNYPTGNRRPWVAEIRRRDERYGYARRFERPARDQSETGKRSKGPILLWYALRPDALYEVHRHIKAGKMERVYLSSAGGAIAEISQEELERELDHRAALCRRPAGTDVYSAARQRIAWIFDSFERVSVSFSGGKDSTVLLHLTAEEARRRRRKIALLFIDWEAQFSLTIQHVERCFADYADCIEPFWVALPLTTVNACSQIEPEWVSWDPRKREAWVRQPPAMAITDPAALPFYPDRMTFEEFAPAFGRWRAGDRLGCNLLGLRADESLNRLRALIQRKTTFQRRPWTTWQGGPAWNAYPIYDWKVADVWTYTARESKSYNTIYDRMHQAGLTPSQMRVDEPYGPEARRGMWLAHVLEPESWPRLVARVAGANMGALYAAERGSVLGNGKIAKPENHTWRSFAELLLDTMPPQHAAHYRAKIEIWQHWYSVNQGIPREAFADELDGDMAGRDQPSWRRVCKTLLGNDYWCKGLGFSPTMAGNASRYQAAVRKKMEKWSAHA